MGGVVMPASIDVSVAGFIISNSAGEELGYLDESTEIDLDIGEKNDFELRIGSENWDAGKFGYGNRIFIPGTEYGGTIDDIESVTSLDEVIVRGTTWRGMLEKKVVEPPNGQEHLVLSGELNTVIRELIESRFDCILTVPKVNSGIAISNWKVDRYVLLSEALEKLLNANGCRLQIMYVEPEENDYGYVTMQAVPIVDYSEELEYSKDVTTQLDVRDYRRGINHLVCAGEGQDGERTVLHLYVQKDGTIGKEQCYFGWDEREAVYIFTSADAEKLEEDGTKRLKELQNYKSCGVKANDANMELGDIIGGYDPVTNTQVKKPIISKILTIKNENASIEYRTKGDE